MALPALAVALKLAPPALTGSPMRPLELTLAAVLGLHLLISALLSRRQTPIPGHFALATAFVGIGQLAIEGYRWQMLPLYAYTAVLAWTALRRLQTPAAKRPTSLQQMWRMLGASLALVLALLLPSLLPVPQFPAPAGTHPVGTTTFELVDHTRSEIYGDNSGQPRRLLVQMWYPAEVHSAPEKAPWMEHIDRQIPALAKSGGMPEFLFSHLVHTQTHSYLDPPLSPTQDRYPLLLFSHGYGGWRSGYTFLVEELASHGYVIASIEHTYAALNTIFPDGRTAPLDPATLPDEVPDEVYDAATKRLLEQWVGDAVAVSAHLAGNQLDGRASQLNGRLDFERLGMIGHSTGGGAAIQFCAENESCRLAIGLDPWLQPVSDVVVASGMTQPGLFMFSDPQMAYFEPENRQRFDVFAGNTSGPLCDMTIADSGHHDFDDTGTFSPAARFLGYSKGPIPIERAFDIIRAYTQAYLIQVFEQPKASPSLSSMSSFLEVTGHCSQ